LVKIKKIACHIFACLLFAMQKPEGRKYDKLFFLDPATLYDVQGILQA